MTRLVSLLVLLLMRAVMPATATSETVIFTYHLTVGLSYPDKISVTLTARDNDTDLIGTGLWKMGVFVSQKDDPSNTTGVQAYQEQALDQAEQDQNVVAEETLTFDTTLSFQLSKLGGCESDYKYICVSFSKGDKPDPSFDLYNSFEKCILMGTTCLADDEKLVSFSSYSWSLNGDTLDFTVAFHDSSRQNLEGTGLWKLEVGWTKEDDPNAADSLDKMDILSSEQSSTNLVNGEKLSFRATLTYDKTQVGCGVDQYRYFCFTFGKGDSPNPDYDLSSSIGGCKLMHTCEEF
ncbi:uncharacterized protein LOC110974366 [Acanthaster planci]|uniref:Uncharacterized protein LOC110974366 n=1 Tax=Acanthaster planci TaxID=133434 RepID=A0A8B7XNR6_ACAPL|nr:uncharacterized protein LOC110974366 [Acanthaster planci]